MFVVMASCPDLASCSFIFPDVFTRFKAAADVVRKGEIV